MGDTLSICLAVYLALGLIVAMLAKFDPSGDGLAEDTEWQGWPLGFILTPYFLICLITVAWPICLAFYVRMRFGRET